MTAMLDEEVADLRRTNAELQQRLDERTRERDEALAQKAAMAEVMGVINSSPGNLAPVFDAMLERAVRLCEVDIGMLWIYDGEMVHAAAAGPEKAIRRRSAELLAGSARGACGSCAGACGGACREAATQTKESTTARRLLRARVADSRAKPQSWLSP